jgi:hypothetical protein
VSFSSLPADNPNNRVASEFQNAGGTLNGAGFLAQGNITDATGGLVELLFLEVENPNSKSKCHTAGDSTGEVLLPRLDFNFVHDESPEQGAAILYTVPEFTIECGTEKIKLKGTVLSLLLNLPSSGDVLSLLTLTTHCSSTVGEPSDVHYWTSLLLSELTALLLANFGAGFRKACEQINGTAGTVDVSVSKMIELQH